MELGIITDEVHPDFATATVLISEWGLPLAEVRVVNGKNVTQLTDEAAAEAAATLHRHGLRVSAIASPVFKSPFDERPSAVAADFGLSGAVSVEAQLRVLERSCELANLFGTRLVRVFTFLRVPWSESVVNEAVRRMVAAAEVAARHDVVLAVENEPVCVVGTGAELGAFIRLLDEALPPKLRAHVGALWDPGNALADGELNAFPDGYEALPKGRIEHVHLKNASTLPARMGTFVPLDEGLIDYEGQFKALLADGYKGAVVLEPHYAPAGLDPAAAAERCVRAAQRLLSSAGAG